MSYSAGEIIQYIEEEDVKFIRLAFCDVYGKQKNISIMQSEIDRAFEHGVAIDASAIFGFGEEVHSDLFLHPDPSTITVLPWRPEHGKVVRMFCDITYPDGRPFEKDTRRILKKAISTASEAGYSFFFGSEMEFYLFKTDDNGNPTKEPHDEAGYMDIAPEDKGENVRREICLTLEKMGIHPESSHHEEGPGQNEIDFRYSDPLTAADNAVTFCSVVRTIATLNGLYADFSPKPFKDKPGSGFHINVSVQGGEEAELLSYVISGILEKIIDMSIFLNPRESSYERFGSSKAPIYVTWSPENRSSLIRVPSALGEYKRVELRSPDPLANPYLAFALIIYAGLYGIQNKITLPKPVDINLFEAPSEALVKYNKLPENLSKAKKAARNSEFISKFLPLSLIDTYCMEKKQ
ncbi:MAG: glutamine synthetase family protein [Clostridiaceae bacterium]